MILTENGVLKLIYHGFSYWLYFLNLAFVFVVFLNGNNLTVIKLNCFGWFYIFNKFPLFGIVPDFRKMVNTVCGTYYNVLFPWQTTLRWEHSIFECFPRLRLVKCTFINDDYTACKTTERIFWGWCRSHYTHFVFVGNGF